MDNWKVARDAGALLTIARAVNTTRHGTHAVIGHVTDKRFQAEVGAALGSLQAAAGRTQRLGLARAAQDERVARHVREAMSHLSVALYARRRRSRKLRRAVMGAALLSAVAGAAVLGTKSRL